MSLPIPLEAGRLTLGRTYTYIIKSRLAISFGEVADWERKHPGDKASGHLGVSGKEASEIRGAKALGRRVVRALGRRVARAFLGLLTILGGLALGPSPIGAFGLGQLARGIEPGPMVPTMPPFFLPGRVIVPGRKKKEQA